MADSFGPPKSEIRKHYWLDQYVVIAASRSHSLRRGIFNNLGEWDDPHPETETSLYEIHSADGRWMIKVVPNLHSALTPDNPDAYGFQEVVLDANPMDVLFSSLSVQHLTHLLHVFSQRLSTHRHNPKIKYVSVFHNTGWEAGASKRDTHSQVTATGVVPPQLKAEAETFHKLKKRYGHSPLAQAAAGEAEAGMRLIYQDKHLMAICPFASQFPYEVWLVPHKIVRSLTELSKTEQEHLAKGLKLITLALEKAKISYNFMLSEDVKGLDNHFMIRVTPRSNVWAGFELSTGMVINPVAPEEATHWYRKSLEAEHVI